MAKSTRSRSAERLVDILVELHLHGVVNRSALMDKFKITERTVYRDLNALSRLLNIPEMGYIGSFIQRNLPARKDCTTPLLTS